MKSNSASSRGWWTRFAMETPDLAFRHSVPIIPRAVRQVAPGRPSGRPAGREGQDRSRLVPVRTRPERIRVGRPCAEWAGTHGARPPRGQQVALLEIFTPLMVMPALITVVVF